MAAMLDISKALKYPGQAYLFESDCEIEEMEVLNDPVQYEDVLIKGEYFGAGNDKVSLKGTVTAVVTSRCAKCLESVSLPLQAELDAQFARQLDPEAPDLYTYESSKVDLTDAVRDALLLELPYRFLCSEDCKGLCSICGANLNLGTWTCQEGYNVTNPFSALKALVQNNEEV